MESTKQVITEKITKLETYYDRIERADVYIKDGDGQAANGYTVEARLSIPGPDLFAEYTDPSIKRAIADVAEALRACSPRVIFTPRAISPRPFYICAK